MRAVARAAALRGRATSARRRAPRAARRRDRRRSSSRVPQGAPPPALGQASAANGSFARSASGRPRQSASASRSVRAASSAESSPSSRRPRSTSAPEALEIDLLGCDLEDVARRSRDEDAVRLEGLSESGDMLLKRRGGIRRRPLAPELVDQPIARDGLAGVENEDREHAALPGAAERKLPLAVTHLERAENAEIERARQIANVPRSRCQSTDSALRAPRERPSARSARHAIEGGTDEARSCSRSSSRSSPQGAAGARTTRRAALQAGIYTYELTEEYLVENGISAKQAANESGTHQAILRDGRRVHRLVDDRERIDRARAVARTRRATTVGSRSSGRPAASATGR